MWGTLNCTNLHERCYMNKIDWFFQPRKTWIHWDHLSCERRAVQVVPTLYTVADMYLQINSVESIMLKIYFFVISEENLKTYSERVNNNSQLRSWKGEWRLEARDIVLTFIIQQNDLTYWDVGLLNSLIIICIQAQLNLTTILYLSFAWDVKQNKC